MPSFKQKFRIQPKSIYFAFQSTFYLKENPMETDTFLFTRPDSIMRKIWGQADVVLFIFAGASAEFALNKAVDWLYFTGKLPADPIGRLFSTLSYANKIIFSQKTHANQSIDKISSIHSHLEDTRQQKIPQWAY